jgi:hypothetical protein
MNRRFRLDVEIHRGKTMNIEYLSILLLAATTMIVSMTIPPFASAKSEIYKKMAWAGHKGL